MNIAIGSHADRPVQVASRDGRDVVVKRYLRADGERIWTEHCAVWQSRFGAGRRPVPGLPEPMAWRAADRELVMELVPGQPVGARGDLGRSVELCEPIACLLADFHSSEVLVARRRDARRIVRSLHRKASELAADPVGGAYGRAVRLLDDRVVLSRVARHEQLVVTHGDWSPRNVLAEPDGSVRLIDLDRLQMAGPAHDVAYWGAWCWATELMAGQQPAWEHCSNFTGRYVEQRPEARQQLADTMWFHRAAALLRIAHGWSALATMPERRSEVVREASRWAAEA